MAFSASVCIGVGQLRFAEFDTAARMILDGAFRGSLNMQIALRNLEKSLSNAATPEECWSVLKGICNDFGFTGIQMRLAGKLYTVAAKQTDLELQSDLPLVCCLEIPLSLEDYVYLTRESIDGVKQTPVLSLADVIRASLGSKFAPETAAPNELELAAPTGKVLSASAAG
jgi:hypothetical protein